MSNANTDANTNTNTDANTNTLTERRQAERDAARQRGPWQDRRALDPLERDR